jgi:succinate dehydrogenase / fumarate reductase cytochrome b subunit
MHLCVLGSNLLFGDGSFDALMGNFSKPLFKLMEIGLIGTIAFHGVNGIRIIIADFFGLTKYQKVFFWFTMLIVLAIVVVSFKVFFLSPGQ